VEIADWHKRGQSPVPGQQQHKNQGDPFESKKRKNDTGKQVAESDSLQHTQPADVFNPLREAAINNQTEDVNNQTANQDPLDGPGSALGLDHSRDGEDDRNTGNENEQGKDQIVKG